MKIVIKKLKQMRLLLRKIERYKYHILTISILAFVTGYISVFWYQLALIQGKSMEPAYKNGQFVLIEKQYSNPAAGEVFAVYNEALNTILIKRVVAVPGDTVLIRNGVLYVNGVPSPNVRSGSVIEYAGIAEEPVNLLEKEYFVLGDNYEYSKDSRYREIGYVTLEEFVGKIFPQK